MMCREEGTAWGRKFRRSGRGEDGARGIRGKNLSGPLLPIFSIPVLQIGQVLDRAPSRQNHDPHQTPAALRTWLREEGQR